MEAHVRPFVTGDVDSVGAVLMACAPDLFRTASFPDIVRRAGDWRLARAFTGTIGGAVAGFAALVPEDAHAYIAYLHVHPVRRRSGLGTPLLEALESSAAGLGCGAISTCGYPSISPFFGVDADDSGSVRFFERHGYRERSRSLHRRLELDRAGPAEARRPEVAGYRLDVVHEGDPDYWAARRGIVQLCARGEEEFASFTETYDGHRVDVSNAGVAVAWDADRLVGFCGFVPAERARVGHEGEPQCGPLLVHPAHRGHGIASALHDLALAALSAEGCTTAALGSDAGAAVVRIHDRLGFRTVTTWIQFERPLGPRGPA